MARYLARHAKTSWRRKAAVGFTAAAMAATLGTLPLEGAVATGTDDSATGDEVVLAASELTIAEQLLLQYDVECERLAVSDCATYDGSYDAGYRLFEDPATGEDFVTNGTTSTPWFYRNGLLVDADADTAAPPWTCTGNAYAPIRLPSGFIDGLAEQFCSGSGWQSQRVVTAVQWKHTRRFGRDHYHTVSETIGSLSNESVTQRATTKRCPGTRQRTYRTKGVGYAVNDAFGGETGGGLEYSEDDKVACNLTAH